MITIIDETVMLRYLLNDNKRQARQAREIIATGRAYTYAELLARVAVTLRDVYGIPRLEIASALDKLLDDVVVIEPDIVRLACRYFGNTLLDFTDCMMIARNVLRNYQIKSFDKAIVKRMLITSEEEML